MNILPHRFYLRASKSVWLITFVTFLAPSIIRAADFQGALSILEKVAEQSASTNALEKAAPETSLRNDLKNFQKTVKSLTPQQAATTWLELVDRALKLSSDSQRDFSRMVLPISENELLETLPPPDSWAALAQAIFARPAAKEEEVMREAGLRLLAATLIGDNEARKSEVAALQSRAEKVDAQSMYMYRSALESISEAMLATMDDPEAVLKTLERQLSQNKGRGPLYLRIPNLVSLVGAEKSEAFLRKALQVENSTLSLQDANDTSRLAQKLALEMMDTLKSPHWELVNSLDSVELYEALDKRFSKEKEAASVIPPAGLENLPDLSALSNDGNDSKKAEAQTYYLLGLISKQRSKDAVAVAKQLAKERDISLPTRALKSMERAGYTKALDDFFFELLSQDPTLPFWGDYVQLSAKAGKTDRMLALARATAARDDLSKAKKSVIDQTLFRALLAAEQVDEGVAEMRRLIEKNVPSGEFDEQTPGHLSIMLARIGVLLNKPEWIDEGIVGAKKSIAPSTAKRSRYGTVESVAPALANLLVELNRGAEAEAILAEALANTVKNKRSTESYFNEETEARGYLGALAVVYHKSGRHQDVLTLLEKAPYWNAKDLAEMRKSYFNLDMPSIKQVHNSSSPLPIDYIAGNALAAVGRKDEARTVVNDLLNREPGLDRAYELLFSLGEKSAMDKLDELFALDQFEERPLIWKAELLRRENKLEEAEKIVRQAISIDPSDGEQGPDDRLRAYAVLADIREARGDSKEAEFFRGAVNAIRLSEKADKYYTAGLLKPAIKMYENSLKLFSDAYCIQSRLAIQLSELGMHDEAEAHYRRAYELMPESFGRVESHCFGCERAFEGQRAQSLAEKVFADFAKKSPNKPQVHYLLGYLRAEQERHAEALPHFQEAVRLDSDYLNAWKKLQELGAQVRLSKDLHNDIVLNILRLDPLSRHVHASYENVTDLAGLWNAVEAGQKQQPEPATRLLSLEASKAALEKKNSEPKTEEQSYQALYEQMYRQLERRSPAHAVAQTPFVRIAAGLFGGNNRYGF